MFLDDGSGNLDRDALRRIILEDDKKRRRLDGITHPYILWQMAWEVFSLAAAGNNFAVLDIPLLFETGGTHHKVFKIFWIQPNICGFGSPGW